MVDLFELLVAGLAVVVKASLRAVICWISYDVFLHKYLSLYCGTSPL